MKSLAYYRIERPRIILILIYLFMSSLEVHSMNTHTLQNAG